MYVSLFLYKSISIGSGPMYIYWVMYCVHVITTLFVLISYFTN